MGFPSLYHICQAKIKTIGAIQTVTFYLVLTLVFVTRSLINQFEKKVMQSYIARKVPFISTYNICREIWLRYIFIKTFFYFLAGVMSFHCSWDIPGRARTR